MKRLILAISIIAGLTFAVPSFAQVGQGLSGPHYNLNIIGVANPKTADMTDTSRHTLFVPLSGSVKITYIAGTEFQVLDGNCTDADGCTIEVPSDPLGDLCYDVYATGLGKPNAGQVIVNASCTIDGLIGSCADALLLDTFTVDRPKGKPRRQNISDVFRATGCVDLGGVEGICDTGDLQFNNVWIFNIPQLLDYFWDYTNTGLRLMQVRFYQTTCGSFTTVP
jgi:hypothetical protein